MPSHRTPRAPRPGRLKRMSSSARSVLSMPEVLEMILLNLPTRELLINAQRVNRDFRDVIANSPHLQRTLFFRCMPTDSMSNVRMNPFLTKSFPTFFGCTLAYGKDLHRYGGKTDEYITEAYEREEASWRRMLLAQPPVLEIQIYLRSSYNMSSNVKALLRAKDGITMGLLYDAVEESYRLTNDAVQQQDSYYFIHWYLRKTEVHWYHWKPYFRDYSILNPVEGKAEDRTAKDNIGKQNVGRIELQVHLSRNITVRQKKKFIKNLGCELVYAECDAQSSFS